MPKAIKSGNIELPDSEKMTSRLRNEDEYRIFLKSVELLALGLNSVEAKLDRTAYAAAHSEEGAKIEKIIDNSFEVSELTEDHFDVASTFVLTMQLHEQSPFLSISLRYEAHFHWNGERPKKQYVTRFAKNEARLVFWPYFRQAIADITSKMYIRQVTIPLKLSF